MVLGYNDDMQVIKLWPYMDPQIFSLNIENVFHVNRFKSIEIKFFGYTLNIRFKSWNQNLFDKVVSFDWNGKNSNIFYYLKSYWLFHFHIHFIFKCLIYKSLEIFKYSPVLSINELIIMNKIIGFILLWTDRIFNDKNVGVSK